MGKIIFLNCFSRQLISGGIKTTYAHAALLRGAGIDAKVYQPDGIPEFLRDMENIKDIWLGGPIEAFNLQARDIVVFPETLNGIYEKMILAKWPCRKMMFCQNPYYFMFYSPTAERLAQWNIEQFFVPSHFTARMLNQIARIPKEKLHVVSPILDRRLFRQGAVKRRHILCFAWKWNQDGNIAPYSYTLEKFFRLSRPDLKEWAWLDIRNKSQQETAQLLGEACVSIVMGRLESLGMTALESMASHALVCGFHGGGGQEYATAENGFWHSPEDLESLAISVGKACDLWRNAEKENFHGEQADILRQRIGAGEQTAEAYFLENMKVSIVETYKKFL